MQRARASPTTSTFTWCPAGAGTRTSWPSSTTSRSSTRRWLRPRTSSEPLSPKRKPAATDGRLDLAVVDDRDVAELAPSKRAEVVLHPRCVGSVRGVGTQRRGPGQRELRVPAGLLAPGRRGRDALERVGGFHRSVGPEGQPDAGALERAPCIRVLCHLRPFAIGELAVGDGVDG